MNLPEFEVRLKVELQRTQIFDAFRNKFVQLSPEEWVRQHMLHFLVNERGYPAGLTGVEVSLKLNGMAKRADIVVYDKSLNPWMLVECKAPSVKLSQAVFDQAARYNLRLQVPYLVITNGLKILAAEIQPENNRVIPLNALPSYPAD